MSARVAAIPLFAESRTLAHDKLGPAGAVGHCPFCGTEQAGRTDSWCAGCASPLPTGGDPNVGARATDAEPDPQSASIHRGRALEIHARWPLAEPVAATLQRLMPDRLEFTAPHAFAADQLLKIDAPGLRALGRVTACRPAALERFRVTVTCLSLSVDTPA